MRALLQRVSGASVRIDERLVGSIGAGWAVLLGVGSGDDPVRADRLAERVAHLRAFEDSSGRMNLSVLDVGGAALVISQFTLYADTRRGRRPSFADAAPPAIAAPLVEHFVDSLRGYGVSVETGRFGAYMRVEMVNDGPVTFMLET